MFMSLVMFLRSEAETVPSLSENNWVLDILMFNANAVNCITGWLACICCQKMSVVFRSIGSSECARAGGRT